jgi:hypothetical protein
LDYRKEINVSILRRLFLCWLLLAVAAVSTGCTTTPRRVVDNSCSALVFVHLHISALIPSFLACTFGADEILKDQGKKEEKD